jgi:hypothetical protein
MNALFIPMGIIKTLDEVFADNQAQKLIRTEQIEGVNTKRVTQIAFQIR